MQVYSTNLTSYDHQNILCIFDDRITLKSMLRATCLLIIYTVTASSALAQSFGGALAITDQYIFVGETRNVAFQGEVYIYDAEDSSKKPTILSVNQELERFGRTLAVQGQTLFVSAHEANESRGAVDVFQFDDTWEHLTRLTASDGHPEDQFGLSIAVQGRQVFIGAPGRNESTGAVYIFTESTERTYIESHIIIPSDVSLGDRFGSTLAVDGHLAAISALSQSESRGAVYGYRNESDQWVQIGKLSPDFLSESSRMGSSLLIHDARIFAGAPLHDEGRGLVFEIEFDSASNQMQIRNFLQPLNQERMSQFGAAITFAGEELWVGSNRSNRGRGMVHQFRPAENGWTDSMTLHPHESIGRAAFGSSLVAHKEIAVVGAVYMDSRAGGAIVLRQNDSGWNTERTLINGIKSHDAITGGEVRCSQGKAAKWSCGNVDMTAFLPLPQMGGNRASRLNDIWGWTDPQTSREYALVGRNDGTSFVDVTDPELPIYVGNLPMTAGSVANVWRDIKVYANHAYVVADGADQHGVQIFDLTQLREIDDPPVTFEETAIYTGIASAHNIVINEQTGFGYVVGASGGGQTCGGGLHMLDLRDQVNISFAGCFADPNTGRRNTGYSHDAQCVIYSGPDTQYSGREICLGSNETALSIADVSDKNNPIPISVATYPKVAYTHQGWLTEDHRYFYMNDEGDEPQGLVEGTRTLIWDVSDLDDPVLITEYIATTSDTDHNLYIRGDLMYQSNYGAGLRILDISSPATPVEIGFFEPGPGSTSWSNYPYFESGTLIVTSGTEGLFILKKRELDI